MEYASGLIKLKSGTEEKVEEWRGTIASRLDEAAATLRDEDVQIESWFKIEINGEKYLLWYLHEQRRIRGTSIHNSNNSSSRFHGFILT